MASSASGSVGGRVPVARCWARAWAMAWAVSFAWAVLPTGWPGALNGALRYGGAGRDLSRSCGAGSSSLRRLSGDELLGAVMSPAVSLALVRVLSLDVAGTFGGAVGARVWQPLVSPRVMRVPLH